MTTPDSGLIGLAVMGQNLALNMANHGYTVAVYNRTTAKMDECLAANPGASLVPARSLQELVDLLPKPRKSMLMVKAGADAVIAELQPLLEAGDMIIEGGNAFFRDTEARAAAAEALGLHYVGTGVSGGEEGALKGPSIMPGGPREAYAMVAPIFEAIAGRAPDGTAVVAYMGQRIACLLRCVTQRTASGLLEAADRARQAVHAQCRRQHRIRRMLGRPLDLGLRYKPARQDRQRHMMLPRRELLRLELAPPQLRLGVVIGTLHPEAPALPLHQLHRRRRRWRIAQCKGRLPGSGVEDIETEVGCVHGILSFSTWDMR